MFADDTWWTDSTHSSFSRCHAVRISGIASTARQMKTVHWILRVTGAEPLAGLDVQGQADATGNGTVTPSYD